MVNNALVPPPHHKLLQDGQAVTPLQSQATSQAALPPTLPVQRGDFDVPSIPVMPVPGGVGNASTIDGIMIGLPVQDLPAAGQPRQNVGTYKDGPAIICRLPIDGESYDLTFSVTIVIKYAHPVPAVPNQGRFTDNHPHQKTPAVLPCGVLFVTRAMVCRSYLPGRSVSQLNSGFLGLWWTLLQ
jgi:hypothetical protein